MTEVHTMFDIIRKKLAAQRADTRDPYKFLSTILGVDR